MIISFAVQSLCGNGLPDVPLLIAYTPEFFRACDVARKATTHTNNGNRHLLVFHIDEGRLISGYGETKCDATFFAELSKGKNGNSIRLAIDRSTAL